MIKKALVSEDDIVSRTLVKGILDNMGFAVIQCSNGRRALDILIDNPDIDLIVADIIMPDLDGRDLIRTIRGHEALKEKPIIIVSGIVKMKEISNILELGASVFCPKPINTKEFKEYVELFVK